MWKAFDLQERVDVQLSRARREEINRHNEEVRQNRKCLKASLKQHFTCKNNNYHLEETTSQILV